MDWGSFRVFVGKKCSEGYAKDLVRYARLFVDCLFNEDFSRVQALPESKRNHVMCALSNLAKFLGIYEGFLRLVKAYGLKWKSVKAEDLLLNRMCKTRDNGAVVDWVRTVKAHIPELSGFVDFVVCSGLRLVEAIESYNLIVDLAKNGRLSEYYDYEKEALEHFRFKEKFIRRTKKAFVSFIPKKLVEAISQKEKLTIFQIRNYVRRDSKLRMRFGDLREYYATVMTKWLNPAEIDFLQGRISGSVFMRNYFNPALISDLKDRVFKGLAEIQSKL
ncbi:MAG: integrase [Candidatus Bathyarchaeia archaeon]